MTGPPFQLPEFIVQGLAQPQQQGPLAGALFDPLIQIGAAISAAGEAPAFGQAPKGVGSALLAGLESGQRAITLQEQRKRAEDFRQDALALSTSEEGVTFEGLQGLLGSALQTGQDAGTTNAIMGALSALKPPTPRTGIVPELRDGKVMNVLRNLDTGEEIDVLGERGAGAGQRKPSQIQETAASQYDFITRPGAEREDGTLAPSIAARLNAGNFRAPGFIESRALDAIEEGGAMGDIARKFGVQDEILGQQQGVADVVGAWVKALSGAQASDKERAVIQDRLMPKFGESDEIVAQKLQRINAMLAVMRRQAEIGGLIDPVEAAKAVGADLIPESKFRSDGQTATPAQGPLAQPAGVGNAFDRLGTGR